jgi:predicted ATP-grasp superfamily ATP-dependent carboligase
MGNRSAEKPIDVVVTDAGLRAGLAVIRALGSKGIRVLAVGANAKSLGFVSRYAAERLQLPSPYLSPKAFALGVRDVVEKREIPLVLPVQDYAVLAIDRFRTEFEGLAQLAIAPPDALRAAFDKKRTSEIASQLGIPMPETTEPTSIAAAANFAEEVGFPVVIKPRSIKGALPVDLPYYFKVQYARDRRELESVLQPFADAGVFPLLQKFYSGRKVNQGILISGGRLVGLYQYQAAREFPLTGGQTCLHVSASVDRELRGWSETLLKEIGWEGPAMMEYRVDERGGNRVLLELNGRFWAPLSAANKLRLNYPYAFYRYLAQGRCETVFGPYPYGTRNMYLRGELIALGLLLAGKTPGFLAPLPSKGRAILDFLRDLKPGMQFDVLDWRDPRPGLREVGLLLHEFLAFFKAVRAGQSVEDMRASRTTLTSPAEEA